MADKAGFVRFMSQARGALPLYNLCVFCGSRTGNDPDFEAFAAQLGREMAAAKIGLVFGGGSVGLMGAVSNAVLAAGGAAIGVIPDFLTGREASHKNVSELIVVPDMHTRKKTMFERADAFCILPGGVGTLEEFLEIVTWRQLSVHVKPIILANWNGYWSPLITMTDAVRNQGFAYGPMEGLFTVVNSVEDILPTVSGELAAPKPPRPPGHPDMAET